MSADLTDPAHYSNAFTWSEQLMRVDFARYHRMDPADMEAVGLRERWASDSDALGREWITLESLTHWYRTSPKACADAVADVARQRAEGRCRLSAIQLRSLEQVAQLLADDAPPRERNRDDISWANAAEIYVRAAYPVSSHFARSRTRELAQAIPGHAFAGLINAHDREGVER